MNGRKLPKLAAQEELLLRILVAEDEEKYGLELVRASKGQVSSGTIYVTLYRMEEKGFVSSREDEKDEFAAGRPRRVYKATMFGRAFIEAANHLTSLLDVSKQDCKI